VEIKYFILKKYENDDIIFYKYRYWENVINRRNTDLTNVETMEETVMLNIAICDDEQAFLSDTTTKIQQYMAEHHPGGLLEIKTFHSGEELFFDIHDNFYDIIFLDIIMMTGKMNGIETAEKIEKISPSSIIVFISSSPEYAVEAYEVNAFYYLTKPVDDIKFRAVLEKCVKRIASLDNLYVNLKAIDGFSKIYLREIVYCFTSGHKITIVLSDGNHVISYMKMSAFLDACFRDKRFLQTHKSFAVNLDYVKSISRKESKILLYKTEAEIPISRDFKASVMEKYLSYVF